MQLTSAQLETVSPAAFLVTGGAGFIGSHIAEFLLTAGARKVRVLDNLSTGHFRNVAPFANHPRFEFKKGDIRDMDTCKAACQGMDYVFHLATDGTAFNNANVSDFLNLLVVAHEAGSKRLVYASGPPKYGESNAASKVEHAFSPDADSKYINELYAEVFTQQYGMETIGLRYSNVYGLRQNLQSEYAAMIPNLVTQLRKHASPAFDNSANIYYDFNYIDDIVRAHVLAMLSTNANALNQVYNITPQEKTSLFQLAVYLRDLLSAFDEEIGLIEIGAAGLSAHDTNFPIAEVKDKELTGYQPRISLQNGLLKSISWYWAFLPQFSAEAAEKKHRELSATTLSL
ncbi:NAD-dependent epimerase/dehydratase family protein [Longitalea luteola]|uniref:NAD-dependent epimerase/dehydratase family protein n=1 Tax=Longitalea luteola TaxID=2812563 RepID=UPI001A96C46B|nr:NAD-dependent epimerase/dehydratase family protein [Longitalea luteola]